MIYDLSWWAVLTAIVPLWLLTNTSHELSHGLAIKVKGWDFKLWVLPVFCDTLGGNHYYIWQKLGWIRKANRPDGYLMFFAMCEYLPIKGHEILSGRDWAWCHIAPRLSNFLIFAVCITTAAFPVGSIIESILAVWVACNLIDYLVGVWRVFVPKAWEANIHTDMRRFQETSGWGMAALRAMSICGFVFVLIMFLAPL